MPLLRKKAGRFSRTFKKYVTVHGIPPFWGRLCTTEVEIELARPYPIGSVGLRIV
ncbi:hypothetical protein DERF_006898, partial [Dermatophagoides farinae]